MSNSFSLDPSFQIAKVFVRLGMIFSAIMVGVFIYLIYLASLGIMSDWDISVQSPFFHYYPDPSAEFWQMLFFSLPAVGFVICFFVLGWLGKRIKTEGNFVSKAP